MAATLACKHCGEPLSAQAIADGELAVCDVCDTLNNLSTQPITLPVKPKEKRPVPYKFQIEQSSHALEISYYPWRSDLTLWSFFNLFWNGLLALVFFGAVKSGIYVHLLFLIPLFVIGLIALYFLLMSLFTRRRIIIEENGLRIIHRPFPRDRNSDKWINRRAIEQVYCKRRVIRDIDTTPIERFDVYYVEGAESIVLIKDLESHQEALFIEQHIENLYHIEDTKVDENSLWLDMIPDLSLYEVNEPQKRKSR
jgi:hypothetical protein